MATSSKLRDRPKYESIRRQSAAKITGLWSPLCSRACTFNPSPIVDHPRNIDFKWWICCPTSYNFGPWARTDFWSRNLTNRDPSTIKYVITRHWKTHRHSSCEFIKHSDGRLLRSASKHSRHAPHLPKGNRGRARSHIAWRYCTH